jgi:hypothetical protein
MSWNFRVVKRYYKKFNEWVYSIHEVFYGDDGTSIIAWSATPIKPSGEDFDSLKWELEAMSKPESQTTPVIKRGDYFWFKGQYVMYLGMFTTIEGWRTCLKQ